MYGIYKNESGQLLCGIVWMFLLDGSMQKSEKLCNPCGEAVLLIGMATQTTGWLSQKPEMTQSSMIMSYYRMKGDPIKEDFEIAMLNIL